MLSIQWFVICDSALRFVTLLSVLQGARLTQLYLDGTIPMIYLETKYHCPIQIWLDYEYPAKSPTCIVDPVPPLCIVPSHDYVMPNGLVVHPYLTNWARGSTLGGLCEALSAAFGQKPPLYTPPTPVRQLGSASLQSKPVNAP
jgi:hypothetical protein